MIKYSVGIDVSEAFLQICFLALRADFSVRVIGTRKFPNTLSGVSKFIEWMENKRKDKSLILQIGMEATGVYHETLAYSLDKAGYGLSILVPGKVKAYFVSLGIISKTDPIDAKGIATMMLERKWDLWTAPSKQMRELRSLYRYRSSLVDQLTQLKNRLHAISHSFSPNKYIVKELNKEIKSLHAQIEKVELQVNKSLDQNSDFSRKVKQIAGSISGVGQLTIGQIAAETDGFALFTSQSQLTSFAGYDVVENQSGSHTGKTKISKRGNKHIRKALHFPAFNVVRFEGDIFEQLHIRVYERTKIKMKGYVAVQRKLLCIIYTLWKNDTEFIRNYNKGKAEAEHQENSDIDAKKAA